MMTNNVLTAFRYASGEANSYFRLVKRLSMDKLNPKPEEKARFAVHTQANYNVLR